MICARTVGRRCRPEHGSGTILVLAVMPLLLAVTTVVIAGAVLVTTRHRAAVAADLAALAAAQSLLDGQGDPCTAAGRVALANEARLESCRLDGTAVEVAVHLNTPGWASAVASGITRRARAGPTGELADPPVPP